MCRIPLGGRDLGIGYGTQLFGAGSGALSPGGVSEIEILLACGPKVQK